MPSSAQKKNADLELHALLEEQQAAGVRKGVRGAGVPDHHAGHLPRRRESAAHRRPMRSAAASAGPAPRLRPLRLSQRARAADVLAGQLRLRRGAPGVAPPLADGRVDVLCTAAVRLLLIRVLYQRTLFLLCLRPLLGFTLFPYTTLFR